MSQTRKPTGYTSLSPYPIIDDADRTTWLVRVLGAQELRRLPDSSRKLMHAEVRVDDTVVMLADRVNGWPAVASHVHVYVPDVDRTYRLALEAGATAVQEPVKKGDADKRGDVKDPGGTTWWLATKVE